MLIVAGVGSCNENQPKKEVIVNEDSSFAEFEDEVLCELDLG